MKTCSIDWCKKLVQARGWCSMHLYRFNKGLDMDTPPMVSPRTGECNVDGCEREQYSKGVCRLHYKRIRKGQDISAPPRIHRNQPFCSIEWCEKPEKANGFCAMHWRRDKLNQDMDKHPPIPGVSKLEGWKASHTGKRRALLSGTDSNLTAEQWADILSTFNYECVYCGDPWEHMDHFIPLSKGGTHTADNVVPACASCNLKKNNKTPVEFIGCGLNE